MTYELSEKLDEGKMPPEWYFIPKTRAELARFFTERIEGWLISKDAPDGWYSFGRSERGKYVISSNGKDSFFDTAEDAASNVWPLSKGKRFVQSDAPTPFPDE